MEAILWTALFIPLATFLVLLLLGSSLPRRAIEYIGPGSILLSFASFCYLLYSQTIQLETTLFTWLPLQGFSANFALHLDAISLLLSLIITGVGFLIFDYSVGYMDHDRDIARYFSVMNFFIFSMLLLVLASDLIVLFIGWEGVGLASYLLIGFWYQRPAAAKAAKKAFVVNRIGDLGLLLGILLSFSLFGTSNMQEINLQVAEKFAVGAPIITILTLLYFWGATAKSAQIPLHTWLPDAMEGPTPVSALIHAATMVTAGVYLVARMHPLFSYAPTTMGVIALVGAATSLYAALSATGQKDLKRVLAYSTVSQLGLMFLACGMGAYYAALFHLTMHAFVKALLFLAAGNVIHMMHGTTLMDKMGGLSKLLRKTNIYFLIGTLSMSGIPPLAIFFSKDLILEEISYNRGYYIAGLCISLLTAFYLTRAYVLTFQGPCRVEKSALATLKEAPSIMMIPVMILALLSTVAGALEAMALGFHINVETWISVAVAISGVSIGAYVYNRTRYASTICLNSFYINELYDALIVRPLRSASKGIADFFEPTFYSASIEKPAQASSKTAATLQEIQNGQIRSYIAWLVMGAALFIIYLVFMRM
jgi:NADH-quinone oxidoreductase subunit L